MADTNELTKTVVQVLNDGARGFAELGEKLEDPAKKAFFQKESQTRAEYAREVASVAGISAEDAGGTAAGTAHRVWGDVKSSLGGGDHALLETAEQGEDAAKKAYQKAIESENTPAAVKTLLERQQTHIHQSHDQVKAYRDSTK